MKHWDIKTRIIILALLPSVIINSILACYFVYHRYADLQHELQEQGQFLINQMASLSKPGLLKKNNDTSMLQGLVEATLQNPLIDAASIYDKDGRLLAYAGPINLRSLSTSFKAVDYSQTTPTKDQHDIFYKKVMINNLRLDSLLTQETQSKLNHRIVNKQTFLGWVSIHFNSSTFRIAEYHALAVTILILFVGILLSIFVAWQVGRSIAEPFTKILYAINKIKHGELSTRINLHAKGQLKTLVDGINRMAAAMQSAQDELQQNIEQATADLTESLETVEIQNIELDMARKEALEASRVKSEFLANISHEIRTPMNSIIGFTDLLLKGELDEHQQDYLLTMKKSAEALLVIINDILDFSKIEAGKLRLHYTPMDIREVIEDALQLLAPNAQVKQLPINKHISQEVPRRIIGDPLRIKQVMVNLVNNAIKFTEQGQVDVMATVSKTKDKQCMIKIEVIDTGVGLSKQEQKQLFRPFAQADSTLSRKYGGTGLGLAISKKLITQMGGTIGVKSKAGSGSTFWFTIAVEQNLHLPLEAKSEPLPTPSMANKATSQSTLDNDNVAATFHKTHIDVLVVDDNAANLKLLVALLDYNGIHVDQADSGARALNLASQRRYDIILTDIQMPNIDGIELSDRLRRPDQMNQATPIIAISAHVIGYELSSLKQAGINDFLIKPIDTKQLYNLLTKWTQFTEDSMLHQKQTTTATAAENKQLLDKELALNLAGGKVALAKELTGMLLQRLETDVMSIDQAYQANDMAEFHQHIHKLHGACCYCGIPKLKKLVSDIETAIKTEQTKQLELLYAEFKQLIARIKTLNVEKLFPENE